MQLPSKDDLFGYYQTVSSKVKQYVRNLTPLEQKVMDATSNEPWGPHGTVMSEITRSSFNSDDFRQIMGVLAQRLQEEGENWRHVYKSLLLVEYMCKHGPQRVVDELYGNLYSIEKLQRFEYKDRNGKDWGLNVRQRAKEVHGLIANSDRLKQERKKAKENEAKYTGVSAEDARMGKGFGSSSSYGSEGAFRSSVGFGSGSGSIASRGFGSTTGGFRSSQERYDDHDEGHQSLRLEDSDIDEDNKAATKRRIAALKADGTKAERAASPLKGGRSLAAAGGETKQTKRLSQVKVDPSIALSLGKVKPAASNNAPIDTRVAVQTQPELDLLAEVSAESSQPHQPANLMGTPEIRMSLQNDDWDAFTDVLQGADNSKAVAGNLESLLGGPQLPAVQAGPQSEPSDPFSLLGNGSLRPVAQNNPSDTMDFFGNFSTGPAAKSNSSHALGPTPKKDNDPFASISGANFSAPSPALHDLRPAKAAADPFALSSSQPPQSGQSGATALPEDIFSSPNPINAHKGASDCGSPNLWSQSNAARELNSKSPAVHTEDFFASMSLSSNTAAGESPSHAQALGGGAKMAPNLPQPSLPPPVVKKDPFAGLVGF